MQLFLSPFHSFLFSSWWRDLVHSTQIEKQLSTPLQLSPSPKAFHPSDILHSIKVLPTKKAMGYDLITHLIKNVPHKANLFLTYIYNAVLRTTYFPILWKIAIVMMIPKPKKPSHIPSSYRLTGLLPILDKSLKKLLFGRFLTILEPQNIILHHQFGFQHQHSTIQQSHHIFDRITSSFEHKQ